MQPDICTMVRPGSIASPVLPMLPPPNRFPAPRRAALRAVAGGGGSRRQGGSQPVCPAAPRRHSPTELGLLALCAVCTLVSATLLLFTFVRDQAYLSPSSPQDSLRTP
jgi:hypothetical protein